MIDLPTLVQRCCKPRIILGEVVETNSISTDTRTIKNGDVFLALKGENFDGNNYLELALSSGAAGCIYDAGDGRNIEAEELHTRYPHAFFIGVDNSEKYFQGLAKLHHEIWRTGRETKTIGITGSNGKTTTKELLAGILEKLFPGSVLYTLGNFNNHLGLPMTLFRLRDVHHICILEMGTNHPGEIPFLCSLGEPDVGIITSIGQSHLEFFENEENVFKEKRTLFDYVNSKGGSFVVDGDNEFLRLLESPNLIKVGFDEGNTKLSLDDKSFSLEGKIVVKGKAPNLTGKHNFKNLSLCISLLVTIFPEFTEQIVSACVELKLPDNNRSQFIRSENKLFFLDAYNANPSSMKASIETFVSYLKDNSLQLSESVFILGDMNELGAASLLYHEKIGTYLKDVGVEIAIFVGRYSGAYKKGFGPSAKCFSSTNELKQNWQELLGAHGTFFLKGSRTLQLESLMTQI